MARTSAREVSHFLNVDLELASKKDLGPLLVPLAKNVVILADRKQRGVHRLSLELYEFSRYRDPNACIARFVQLVRRLPTPARKLWDRATERTFDVGVQAGSGTTFAARLETSTLRRVAEIGGALVITVYARTRSARPRSKR